MKKTHTPMTNERFYELKNEIHELREQDRQTTLRVQNELNKMDAEEKTYFDMICFNDEYCIFKRGGKWFGLFHLDISKADLRDYVEHQEIEYETEKDEDGLPSYYYNDDSWEVDCDVVDNYLRDYVDNQYEIKITEKNINDGDVFQITMDSDLWDDVECLQAYEEHKWKCKDDINDHCQNVLMDLLKRMS